VDRRRVEIAAVALAVVLMLALTALTAVHLRPVLDSPGARRGEIVAVLAPVLVSIASALLVRRRADRPWPSAIRLGLAVGLLAYSIAGVGFFVLGDYDTVRLVAGPLLVGVWFAMTGLIALAPALVYVVYSRKPHPAVVVALTAAAFLSQLAPLVAPVGAAVIYWWRAAWTRYA